MKKISQIAFILLAFTFAFKSLSFVAVSFKMSLYNVDMTGSESKNGEAEEIKMKHIFEEGKLSDSSQILLLNSFIKHFFHMKSESVYFPPYFEIFTPPPELS